MQRHTIGKLIRTPAESLVPGHTNRRLLRRDGSGARCSGQP